MRHLLSAHLVREKWFKINNMLAVRFCLLWLIVSLVPVYAAPGDSLDIDLGDLDALMIEKKRFFRFGAGGYVKNETAYRFDEPRSFTKIRNTLSLNMFADAGQFAHFYASGRAYYDPVYDLFNYETIAARTRRDEKEPLVFIETLKNEEDNNVVELREFYLDLAMKNIDLRLGKQFVIWGVLEGIRIVDEINPMDFRELILLDLLDYRIPLWTAKANIYLWDNDLEFLWIPDLRFHKAAPSGSEWELFQVLEKTTVPDATNPLFSEYGAKITRKLFDAVVSLSYFYTWDDYPTTFRVISQARLRSPEPITELAILPTYTRMGILGTTITKEVRGNILKGEFAFVHGKHFAIVDKDSDNDGFLDSDGEYKRNHLRWGLGYDFSLFGADFSPAIAQWVLLDYTPDILTDQFDTTLNLFVRKPMKRHSAVFTLLMLHLLNFKETYLKPKFTFNLNNNFQVATGMDIFTGVRTQFGRASSSVDPGGLIDVEQRAQFLGNFKENDRVFVEFKYSF